MGARENWKGECQEYQSHGKIMERDKTEYPVTQLLKSWMVIGYWSQGPGLVSKHMNKIIVQIWIMKNIVLPSVRKIAVIQTIINSESRVTKKIQDKQ